MTTASYGCNFVVLSLYSQQEVCSTIAEYYLSISWPVQLTRAFFIYLKCSTKSAFATLYEVLFGIPFATHKIQINHQHLTQAGLQTRLSMIICDAEVPAYMELAT